MGRKQKKKGIKKEEGRRIGECKILAIQ